MTNEETQQLEKLINHANEIQKGINNLMMKYNRIIEKYDNHG